MRLKTLLRYQIGYAAMGVAYNLVSFVVVLSGGRQLSTTAPVVGGLVMAVYGLALLPGFGKKIGLYRVLMGLSVVIFGYGGILKHLILYYQSPGLYASFMAWFLAVGINVYGLALNFVAARGTFSPEKTPVAAN